MAAYVYRVADGSLYSYSPSDTPQLADAAALANAGLAVVSGLPAQDPSHQWDPATKTVITVANPVYDPRYVNTGTWIMRFTPQEFQSISASTDIQVQQFMYALNHTTQINLNDQLIINGIGYLVSINLLQASRLGAIFA